MKQVRTFREDQELSLRELAHIVGVAHTTIARLEGGETDVSAAVKAGIARALRVPIAEVFPQAEQAP